MAKNREWDLIKAKFELDAVYKLNNNEKNEMVAFKRLWDVKGMSKYKQFYHLHINHVAIILSFLAIFLVFVTIIIGYYMGEFWW